MTAADLGALLLLVLIGMVVVRVQILRRQGVLAMKFGATDTSDYLIPPFALFYIYTVWANALGWPSAIRSVFLPWVAWIGVACCGLACLGMLLSLVAFGRVFASASIPNGPMR